MIRKNNLKYINFCMILVFLISNFMNPVYVIGVKAQEFVELNQLKEFKEIDNFDDFKTEDPNIFNFKFDNPTQREVYYELGFKTSDVEGDIIITDNTTTQSQLISMSSIQKKKYKFLSSIDITIDTSNFDYQKNLENIKFFASENKSKLDLKVSSIMEKKSILVQPSVEVDDVSQKIVKLKKKEDFVLNNSENVTVNESDQNYEFTQFGENFPIDVTLLNDVNLEFSFEYLDPIFSMQQVLTKQYVSESENNDDLKQARIGCDPVPGCVELTADDFMYFGEVTRGNTEVIDLSDSKLVGGAAYSNVFFDTNKDFFMDIDYFNSSPTSYQNGFSTIFSPAESKGIYSNSFGSGGVSGIPNITFFTQKHGVAQPFDRPTLWYGTTSNSGVPRATNTNSKCYMMGTGVTNSGVLVQCNETNISRQNMRFTYNGRTKTISYVIRMFSRSGVAYPVVRGVTPLAQVSEYPAISIGFSAAYENTQVSDFTVRINDIWGFESKDIKTDFVSAQLQRGTAIGPSSRIDVQVNMPNVTKNVEEDFKIEVEYEKSAVPVNSTFSNDATLPNSPGKLQDSTLGVVTAPEHVERATLIFPTETEYLNDRTKILSPTKGSDFNFKLRRNIKSSAGSSTYDNEYTRNIPIIDTLDEIIAPEDIVRVKPGTYTTLELAQLAKLTVKDGHITTTTSDRIIQSSRFTKSRFNTVMNSNQERNVTFNYLSIDGDQVTKMIKFIAPVELEIIASDVIIPLQKAPQNQKALLDLMNVKAFNANIAVDEIRIFDLDGYNLQNPSVGNYKIVFIVEDEYQQTKQTFATLTITNDGAEISSKLVGNTPLIVKKDDPISYAQVTDIINPMVLELIEGQVVEIHSDQVNLISTGNFDTRNAGSYYFIYESQSASGLIKEAFEVRVVDNLDTQSIVKIMGNNPTRIKQRGKFDPIKDPNISAQSIKDGEILDKVEVIFNTVDTSKMGTYQIGYKAVDSTGASGYLVISVEVQKPDYEDVVLSASDVILSSKNAPRNQDELFSQMNVFAFEENEKFENIRVSSLGGYDYKNRLEGRYEIEFEAVGLSLNVVKKTSFLTIISDESPYSTYDLVGNTPIVVKQNDNTTIDQITKLIDPTVLEYEDEKLIDFTKENITLVSTGNYDNNKVGSYYFIYQATVSSGSIANAFEVQVVLDLDTQSTVNISGINPLHVLINSDFDPILTPQIKATSAIDGEITDRVEVIYTTMDITKAGSYNIGYKAIDSKGAIGYLFSVVEVKNPSLQDIVLKSSDAQVDLNRAPKSQEQLFMLMNVFAFENQIKFGEITIKEIDGYDFSTPKVGTYKITFNARGENFITASSTAILTVINDNTIVKNSELIGNSPIEVRQNDQTQIDMITKLINPTVLEYENEQIIDFSQDQIELDFDGNYDNNKTGSYFLIYRAITKTGVIYQWFEIRVIPNIDTQSIVTITADNPINILVNSEFDSIITPNLKAISTKDGNITNRVKTIYSNLDINQPGTYDIGYEAIDLSGARGYLFIKVIVQERSILEAVIMSSDTIVKLKDAPKNQDKLLSLMNVIAYQNNVIYDDVVIKSLGGYDYQNPQIGEYKVIFTTRGENLITASTTSTLKVILDSENQASVKLVGNSPIEVKQNDQTSIEEITKLINPYLFEYEEDELINYSNENINIIFTGNYDNSKVGSYYFIYEANLGSGSIANSFEVRVLKETVTQSVVTLSANDPTYLLVGENFNPFTSTKVKAFSTTDLDISEKIEVIFSNVDTSKSGSYQVGYQAQDQQGARGYLFIAVIITEPSIEDIIIMSSDVSVSLALAPKSQEVLFELMNVVAYQENVISKTVIVSNFDGYDYRNPQIGEYLITFIATGSNNISKKSSSLLKIIPSNELEVNAKLVGNSPILIKQNDQTQITEITKLINLTVLYYENNQIVDLSSENIELIFDGYYDNSQLGSYYFIYQATTEHSVISQAFEVQVVPNIDTQSAVTISGANPINILVGSEFDNLLTPNIKAISSVDGEITDKVKILYSNLNINQVGKYSIGYEAIDSSGAIGYLFIKVIVQEKSVTDVIIMSSSTTVRQTDAPKNQQRLMELMNVLAYEENVVFEQVKIKSLGGFDYENPQIGEYQITFEAKGKTLITATSTSILKVVDNLESSISSKLVGNAPIEINQNDKTAIEQITKLINPYLFEYQDDEFLSYSNENIKLIYDGNYDNSKIGSYYFIYQVSSNSGIISNSFEVRVLEDIVTQSSVLITAIDPTYLLVGSEFDPIISTGVSAMSTTELDITDKVEVIFSNVDTSKSGNYQIGYKVIDLSGAVGYLFITVIVQEPSASDVVLMSSSAIVGIDLAPQNQVSLFELMNVIAYEENIIFDHVIVKDLGGYDYKNPQLGEYKIEFQVTGSNKITKTKTSLLKVIAGDEIKITSKLVGNSPILIKRNDKTTVDAITSLINPTVLEYENGEIIDFQFDLRFEAIELLSTGYYDNSKVGSYQFIYQAQTRSGIIINSFEVQVQEEFKTQSTVTITADNPKNILKNSEFNYLLTPNLEAISTKDGLINEKVKVIYSNVDTSKIGTYYVGYEAFDSSAAVGYLFITVIVQEPSALDVVLMSSSAVVSVNLAPKNQDDIFKLMNVVAYEENVIFDQVIISNLGGYDYKDPQIGEYLITFKATGSNNITTTSISTLKVVEEDAVKIDSKLVGNTPIIVKKDDNVKVDDITKLINPTVLEYENEELIDFNIDQIKLLSTGYYDNSKLGSYYFIYQAQTKSGLIQNSFEVIVQDESVTQSIVTITGDNPLNILVGSEFDYISTPNLDASSTKDGLITDKVEVIYSNLDTNKIGIYRVGYQAIDSSGAVGYLFITVIVQEPSISDVVLMSSDVTVKQIDAPLNQSSLFELMNVVAYEENVIFDEVMVKSLGGYDYENPVVGEYVIEFIAKGQTLITTTSISILKVIEEKQELSSSKLVGNTPIVVMQNDETSIEKITNLINPYLLEYQNGELIDFSSDNINLVSDGNYDNTIVGSYFFIYQVSSNSGVISSSFEVKVLQDVVTQSSVVITANDPTLVLLDSKFDPLVTTKLKALSTTGLDITDQVDVIYSNVDTSKVGSYQVGYQVIDSQGAIGYLFIEVRVFEDLEDPLISATDALVLIQEAPKEVEKLLKIKKVKAIDSDSTDITQQVTVSNFDGYRLNAPTAGTYDIVYSVKTSDNQEINTSAKLTVIASAEIQSTGVSDILIALLPLLAITFYFIIKRRTKN